MRIKTHLIFGILLFVLFLVTGQLMYFHFPDKLAIETDYRLLMRSRHIYILFSALIHMLVGALAWSVDGWRKWMQLAGTVLLYLGSVLVSTGFFVEVFEYKEFSDISALGVQATFAGSIAFLISAKKTAD